MVNRLKFMVPPSNQNSRPKTAGDEKFSKRSIQIKRNVKRADIYYLHFLFDLLPFQRLNVVFFRNRKTASDLEALGLQGLSAYCIPLQF